MITKKRNRAGVLCYYLTEQPKSKSRLEYLEQIDFVNKARFLYPKLEKLLFAPMNEGMASPQYRAKMNRMGLTSGVGDTILLINGVGSIELKRASKKEAGAISKDQKVFALAVESAGGFACVAYGKDAALAALKDYLNK
jgi:hypothetical protein